MGKYLTLLGGLILFSALVIVSPFPLDQWWACKIHFPIGLSLCTQQPERDCAFVYCGTAFRPSFKVVGIALREIKALAPQRDCRLEQTITRANPEGIWVAHGLDAGGSHFLRIKRPHSMQSAFDACKRWTQTHRTGFEK